MDTTTLLFSATVAALSISAFATIPAALAHANRARDAKPASEIYRDRDGEATPESMAAFSNTWGKVSSVLFAAIGLGSQVAFSVLLDASSHDDERLSLSNWLIVASWVGGSQPA